MLQDLAQQLGYLGAFVQSRKIKITFCSVLAKFSNFCPVCQKTVFPLFVQSWASNIGKAFVQLFLATFAKKPVFNSFVQFGGPKVVCQSSLACAALSSKGKLEKTFSPHLFSQGHIANWNVCPVYEQINFPSFFKLEMQFAFCRKHDKIFCTDFTWTATKLRMEQSIILLLFDIQTAKFMLINSRFTLRSKQIENASGSSSSVSIIHSR